MRAEDIPQLLVPAFADEMEVHLAQGRQPAVGIVDGVCLIAVGDLEAVVGGETVDHSAEHTTVVQSVELEGLAVDDRRDLSGLWPQRPDDGPAVGGRVGAEQTVRVVVRPADEAVERVTLDRRHGRDRRGLDRRCVRRGGPRGRHSLVRLCHRLAHRPGRPSRL